MECLNGLGLYSDLSVSRSRARETDTPSLTSAAACLRFAGVIRFAAPIWSSLPQRPQLDSSLDQRAMSSLVALSGSCARADAARPINVTNSTTTDPTLRCI